MDNYGYQIYCTIHLLGVLGLIHEDAPCDLRYEAGERVYNEFLMVMEASKASSNQSEYDDILDYIKANPVRVSQCLGGVKA